HRCGIGRGFELRIGLDREGRRACHAAVGWERRRHRGRVVGRHGQASGVPPSGPAGGFGGTGGGVGDWGGSGGGAENRAWSSGTVCAGDHAAIPSVQTSVVPVTVPLAMPCCIWAMLYGPPAVPP